MCSCKIYLWIHLLFTWPKHVSCFCSWCPSHHSAAHQEDHSQEESVTVPKPSDPEGWVLPHPWILRRAADTLPPSVPPRRHSFLPSVSPSQVWTPACFSSPELGSERELSVTAVLSSSSSHSSGRHTPKSSQDKTQWRIHPPKTCIQMFLAGLKSRNHSNVYHRMNGLTKYGLSIQWNVI